MTIICGFNLWPFVTLTSVMHGGEADDILLSWFFLVHVLEHHDFLLTVVSKNGWFFFSILQWFHFLGNSFTIMPHGSHDSKFLIDAPFSWWDRGETSIHCDITPLNLPWQGTFCTHPYQLRSIWKSHQSLLLVSWHTTVYNMCTILRYCTNFDKVNHTF